MTETASVAGDERLRLFLALRLPGGVLDEIERWQREQLRNVRVVPSEHLHVTLAFLGHRPSGELDSIVGALREAAVGAGEIHLTPVRYRETRSVGMLVLYDEGGRASSLAVDLHERLERLGVYERERRAWLPHLTVIRFRGHATRPRMTITTLPELGSFTPSDAAVYMSTLRPSGAQYSVLESVGVGR